MKTRKWKPFSVLTFSTSSTYTSFSPAASTVVSAVKSLVDKELILDEQGIYSIYDRFFGQYLLKRT